MWELLAPYILVMFLLPLIVKARVKHAYAATKKDDDYNTEKVKRTQVAASEKVVVQREFYGDMASGMAYL